jgi:ferritin-like protein
MASWGYVVMICALEGELPSVETSLAEASGRGDANAIAVLSQRLREIQEGIERGFTELEQLSRSYEEKRRELESSVV